MQRLVPTEIWIKLRNVWFRVSPAQAEMEGFVQAWVRKSYEPTATFLATRVDVVVDGGANVGFYTMLQASRGARVVAFEPNPSAFARLKAGLARNGFDGLVMPIPAALGDEEGHRKFYVAETNTLGGSVFPNLDESERVLLGEVDVLCLDQILDRLGVNTLDILKLDVEGCECLALAGAQRYLNKVRGVVIECHSDQLRACCEQRLRDAGLSPITDDARHLACVSNVKNRDQNLNRREADPLSD